MASGTPYHGLSGPLRHSMICPLSNLSPSHSSSHFQCSKLSFCVLNTLSSFLSQGVCIYQTLWLECLLYRASCGCFLFNIYVSLQISPPWRGLLWPHILPLIISQTTALLYFFWKLISIWDDTTYVSVHVFIVCQFQYIVSSVIAMILPHSSLYPQHLEQCLTFNRHSIWMEYMNKLFFEILCF